MHGEYFYIITGAQITQIKKEEQLKNISRDKLKIS